MRQFSHFRRVLMCFEPLFGAFYPPNGWHFQPVAQKNRAKNKKSILFPFMVTFGLLDPHLCQIRRLSHNLLGQFVKKLPIFHSIAVQNACPFFRWSNKLLTTEISAIFVQNKQKQASFLRLTMCICAIIIHEDLICTPENERRTPPRSAPRQTQKSRRPARQGNLCIRLREYTQPSSVC